MKFVLNFMIIKKRSPYYGRVGTLHSEVDDYIVIKMERTTEDIGVYGHHIMLPCKKEDIIRIDDYKLFKLVTNGSL